VPSARTIITTAVIAGVVYVALERYKAVKAAQ